MTTTCVKSGDMVLSYKDDTSQLFVQSYRCARYGWRLPRTIDHRGVEVRASSCSVRAHKLQAIQLRFLAPILCPRKHLLARLALTAIKHIRSLWASSRPQ